MKAIYREQRFEYADYMEVAIYPVAPQPRATVKPLRRPSTETQIKLNQLNRARECNRVICANFDNKCYYLTLTYKGEAPSEEQVRKDVESFLRKLKRILCKKGVELKWVKTIETGSKGGRIHVHLVITGGLSPFELQQLWGRGLIDCRPLMFGVDGVFGLSKYFVKELRNTAGEPSKKKAWTCSRNCVRPQPKQNDYKYSRKRVETIAREKGNARFFEKLYPEYLCADCETITENPKNGLKFLHLVFYKAKARFDL